MEPSGVPNRAVVLLPSVCKECLPYPHAIEASVLCETEALVARLRVERLGVQRRLQRDLPKMTGVRPNGILFGSAQKSPTLSDLVEDRDALSRSVARVRDSNYFADTNGK